MSNQVAVVLSGCGYLDGAEIQESVFTLLALSQHNVTVQCFAPEHLFSPVNHLIEDLEESATRRDVRREAARIARGSVESWDNLWTKDWDAIIFPGGFGVAKYFLTLLEQGREARVHPVAERLVNEFYQASKPIGAWCIAPALVARVLGKHGVEVTVGKAPELEAHLQSWGAKTIHKSTEEYHVDRHHKIVTTSAYMDKAAPVQVFTGISAAIGEILKMV